MCVLVYSHKKGRDFEGAALAYIGGKKYESAESNDQKLSAVSQLTRKGRWAPTASQDWD